MGLSEKQQTARCMNTQAHIQRLRRFKSPSPEVDSCTKGVGAETKNKSEMTCSSLLLMVGGCDDEENPPMSRKDLLVVVVAGRWVQRRRTSQK